VSAVGPHPVLYIIACGGPPAGQLPAFAGSAQEHGWDVCVIATPDGTKFLDAGRLADLTGHPVRSRYKHLDEPDVLHLVAAVRLVRSGDALLAPSITRRLVARFAPRGHGRAVNPRNGPDPSRERP